MLHCIHSDMPPPPSFSGVEAVFFLPVSRGIASLAVQRVTVLLAHAQGPTLRRVHFVRLCACMSLLPKFGARLCRHATESVLAVQDWLALSQRYYTRPAHEETINDPTNARHYWRFRMQPHVEDLLQDKDLLVTIQNMNLLSGRASAEEVELSLDTCAAASSGVL